MCFRNNNLVFLCPLSRIRLGDQRKCGLGGWAKRGPMVRKLILSASMLAVAVLVGAVILRYQAEQSDQTCQVCTRPVHAGMGYRLERSTRSEIACCPRC